LHCLGQGHKCKLECKQKATATAILDMACSKYSDSQWMLGVAMYASKENEWRGDFSPIAAHLSFYAASHYAYACL